MNFKWFKLQENWILTHPFINYNVLGGNFNLDSTIADTRYAWFIKDPNENMVLTMQKHFFQSVNCPSFEFFSQWLYIEDDMSLNFMSLMTSWKTYRNNLHDTTRPPRSTTPALYTSYSKSHIYSQRSFLLGSLLSSTTNNLTFNSTQSVPSHL